jgi:hypothetical protein
MKAWKRKLREEWPETGRGWITLFAGWVLHKWAVHNGLEYEVGILIHMLLAVACIWGFCWLLKVGDDL